MLSRAPSYVLRWHRVLSWAEDVTTRPGWDIFVSKRESSSLRVEVRACSRVSNINDPEAAFDFGVPLEHIDIADGPSRDVGGLRRVVITGLTWVLDETEEDAYDPQWITIGWGMTGHQCTAAAHRFIRAYEIAVTRGLESKRLLVTVLEVKFWTAAASSDYV